MLPDILHNKAAFTRLRFKSNQVSGIHFHPRMYSVHTYPCTPKLLQCTTRAWVRGYSHACMPPKRASTRQLRVQCASGLSIRIPCSHGA